MIDTVAWRIPLTSEIKDAIRFRGSEEVKKDVYYYFEEYRKIKAQFTMNDAKLSFRTYEDDYLYFEGSFPKLATGNNVYLFFPDQLPDFLQTLEDKLRAHFGLFPTFDLWEVTRLDVCYVYNLGSLEKVQAMIGLLSTLRYPRKSFYQYPKESVSFFGRTYSVKFYAKGPEFIKHGMKPMSNQEEALEILPVANGVLRYEVTCRKEYLKHIFKDPNKKKITYRDLLDLYLYLRILNEHLDVLFKGANRETMSDMQVLANLKAHAGSKAFKLFAFYKLLYDSNPFSQEALYQSHDPTTIKRTIAELNKCHVGIPDQNLLYDFNLIVPSPLGVTPPRPPTKAAGGVLV